MITHVRCGNPQCSNYDLWKSVARAEKLGRNPRICALCGGPMAVAKRSDENEEEREKPEHKKP